MKYHRQSFNYQRCYCRLTSRFSTVLWIGGVLYMMFSHTLVSSSSFLHLRVMRSGLMMRQCRSVTQTNRVLYSKSDDEIEMSESSVYLDEIESKKYLDKFYGLDDGDIAKSIQNAKTADEYFTAIKGDEKVMKFLRSASYGHGNDSGFQMSPEEKLSAIMDQQHYLSRRVSLRANRVINLGSPKQIAKLLYGASAGESTDKYTLETRFGNNELAKDVLRWRELESQRRKVIIELSNKRTRERDMSPYEIARQRRNISETKRSFSSVAVNKETSSIKQTGPLVLIDVSGYIFRSYHAMPPLHRSDGIPTGAVLGVCNMFSRVVLSPLLVGKEPRIVLVYDSPGRNFRHDIFKDYKANRSECPEDLVPQFDLVRSAAEAFGIPQVEAQGFEADDVIATLATMSFQSGINVDIYSSDKDLMQLCTPTDVFPKINMVDPVKMTRITDNEVCEKWGVNAALLGDLLALAGDASDNIPGVMGIGPKTAASLLNDFGSLDECLRGAEKIKQKGRREKIQQGAEMARISRKLVELDRYVPFEKTGIASDALADLKVQPLDKKRIVRFLSDMEFHDLKRKITRMFEG